MFVQFRYNGALVVRCFFSGANLNHTGLCNYTFYKKVSKIGIFSVYRTEVLPSHIKLCKIELLFLFMNIKVFCLIFSYKNLPGLHPVVQSALNADVCARVA